MNRNKLSYCIYCILSVMVLMFVSACDVGTFFNDPIQKEKVETQFKKQRQLAKNREKDLFEILERIPTEEREAMTFLYAYMPLSDLADYNSDYFLENIRIALEAREVFSWGKTVSDDLFRHFVLPYRVNNENLDSFRSVYFKELRDRVFHLSMKEAVLEINHWCHEKVMYKSTDSRTSAPLSTIKTAYGRCGEESTFTVSALRTIGIPARQCYTPRWAHCDDNHAWVEVWVEGKWYYLGACEPEPDLNIAWFTEPARRAMLVHTKVFGDYKGPEEILSDSPLYTEINVTSNYAKTKKISVSVEDKNQKRIQGAEVKFMLYNYAEFYPLVKKTTDANGTCSLITGLGDLLVWASKGDAFGYKKISVPETDAVEITLDKNPQDEYAVEYDFVPPIQPEPFPVRIEGKKENERRLKLEDQLRGDYENTFISKNASHRLARKLRLDPVKTREYLVKSRGNWQEISQFFTEASANSKLKSLIFLLLSTVSEKDLRDTPASILLGHLKSSYKYRNQFPENQQNYFVQYILNPRVNNEILSDYKTFFATAFTPDVIKKARGNPKTLVQWIQDNIKLNTTNNYYKVPLTPIGVYRIQSSDLVSRDVFFTALCRSFGIPARLEPGSLSPQYLSNGSWRTVYFEKRNLPSSARGYVKFRYVPNRENKIIPGYYTHFTLARFSNGVYVTLEYDEGKKVTEFTEKLDVVPGHFLLVTGNRLPDGTVLSKLRFFSIKENETQEVPVELRSSEIKPVPYGTFPLDINLKSFTDETVYELTKISGDKGAIIGWLDPEKEPTKHVLSEMAQWKKKFEEWGGGVVFYIMKDKIPTSVFNSYFPHLPKQHVLCTDIGSESLHTVEKMVGHSLSASLPVILFIDKSGKVIVLSEGYKIGIPELLVNQLNRD